MVRLQDMQGGLSNEGVPGVIEGTDTWFFVTKQEIPPDRIKDITYPWIVASIRETN